MTEVEQDKYDLKDRPQKIKHEQVIAKNTGERYFDGIETTEHRTEKPKAKGQLMDTDLEYKTYVNDISIKSDAVKLNKNIENKEMYNFLFGSVGQDNMLIKKDMVDVPNANVLIPDELIQRIKRSGDENKSKYTFLY